MSIIVGKESIVQLGVKIEQKSHKTILRIKGLFIIKAQSLDHLRQRSFKPVSGHNYSLHKLHNVSFSLFLSLKLPLKSKNKLQFTFFLNFYFNRLGILLLCLLISCMRSNAVTVLSYLIIIPNPDSNISKNNSVLHIGK